MSWLAVKAFITNPVVIGVVVIVALLGYISHRENVAATNAMATCKADEYKTALEDTQRLLKEANDAAEAAKKQADITQINIDAVEADRQRLLSLLAAGPKSAYPAGVREQVEAIRARAANRPVRSAP